MAHPLVACCCGWTRFSWFAGGAGSRAEEFARYVEFLASVPLFQTHLPRSELPFVAERLRRKVRRPGAFCVRRGQTSKAFSIVVSGEAEIMTLDARNREQTTGTLRAGDHFGGRSLTRGLPSDYSLKVSGWTDLVTVELSRKDLDELGLSKKLKFPKRAKMYEGKFLGSSGQAEEVRDRDQRGAPISGGEKLLEGEKRFLCESLRKCRHLKALVGFSEDWAKRVSEMATKRHVSEGDEVARYGDLGKDLIVIGKGSIGLVPSDLVTQGTSKSAEGVVQSEKLAQLLLRKEKFLWELSESVPEGHEPDVKRRRASLRANRDDFSPVKMSKMRTEGAPRPKTLPEIKSMPAKIDDMSSDCIDALLPGDTFGELAVLYGSRYIATALALEDSIIYTIRKQHFTCLRRESPKLEEYAKLLKEVKLLAPLIQSERKELARNAMGLVFVHPGERMLEQGKPMVAAMWWVIDSGTCIISRKEKNSSWGQPLAKLSRGGCFGERSILRGDNVSEFNVDAGPDGLTLLTFDGEVLKAIAPLLEVEGSSPTSLPHKYADPELYLNTLASDLSDRRAKHAIPLHTLAPVAKLGEGGFGNVFLVRSSSTGTEFALKQLSMEKCREFGVLEHVRLERDILSMMDNPFIVEFFRCVTNNSYIYMLMEAALGGQLYDLICEQPCVLFGSKSPDSAAMFYIACITLALGYLHKRHVAYRDLKTENVLLDADGYAKLCDMGFARFVLGKTQTLLGTPDYMAPEIIDPPHSHDETVDWWSLGVLSFELLTGQGPWDYSAEDCSDPMEYIVAVRDCQRGGVPEYLLPKDSPLAKDLVLKLLQPQPDLRLGSVDGATEVAAHAWFASKEFDFEALERRAMKSPFRPPASPKQLQGCSAPDGWAFASGSKDLKDF